MERQKRGELQQMPWGRLVEDYQISHQMVSFLPPESELYEWHQGRMDAIEGLFKQNFPERFAKEDTSGKIEG